MIAIIDVNVWISLIIKGNLDKLEEYIFAKGVNIATSNAHIKELYEVLTRQKTRKYLTLHPEFFIDRHLDLTKFFDVEQKFSGSPDPKDDYLFDLAAQSGAKFLVTGDKKLLDFTFPNLEIITMNQFFEKL